MLEMHAYMHACMHICIHARMHAYMEGAPRARQSHRPGGSGGGLPPATVVKKNRERMHACILCMHAYCACMHTMHACMLCMHACYACMHIMHACILCMHAYYACMHIMHACMHAHRKQTKLKQTQAQTTEAPPPAGLGSASRPPSVVWA